MFIRNNKNKLVFIDKKEFYNDVDFYTYLWKIKYNVQLNNLKTQNIKNDIINNIIGKQKFI